MAELKLCIELVPVPLWHLNPRRAMGRTAWDKLRKEVYAQYGYKCGICEAQGRLNCHEIWQYDDEAHIQTLIGFIALCEWCHHIKHIGLAGGLAQEGKLDYERLIQHFLDVNQCTREEFELHKKQAFDQWSERSDHAWEVNWGAYASVMSVREIKKLKAQREWTSQ
jgi:hypothetical protein